LPGICGQLNDAISHAKEQLGTELTPEQAQDVIAKMEHYHDCGIGLNWTVLEEHIWDVAHEQEDI